MVRGPHLEDGSMDSDGGQIQKKAKLIIKLKDAPKPVLWEKKRIWAEILFCQYDEI